MAPKKRLIRSTTDQKLGGVCAGIADYLDTDPTVIRVAYVVLSVFTGVFPGIIVYFVLWVIMPAAETPQTDDVD